MRLKASLVLGVALAWAMPITAAWTRPAQTCVLPKQVQDKFNHEIDGDRIRCNCEPSPIRLPNAPRVKLQQVMSCGEGEGTYHIGFFKGKFPVSGWLQVSTQGEGKVDVALRTNSQESVQGTASFLFMDGGKSLPGLPAFTGSGTCFKAPAKLMIHAYFVKTRDGSGVPSDGNYITAFRIQDLAPYQPCEEDTR